MQLRASQLQACLEYPDTSGLGELPAIVTCYMYTYVMYTQRAVNMNGIKVLRCACADMISSMFDFMYFIMF